jgi:hypothetical protein
MVSLKERLERGEALLAMIDRVRQETGDPNRGAGIERMLIDQVIRDLEEDSRRFREHELVPVSRRRPVN